MVMHLNLCERGPSYSERGFNISRICSCESSEEWSSIDLYPDPEQFPKNINGKYDDVICSVNGLFCLRCNVDKYGFADDFWKLPTHTEYVLWNPSTSTFRLVPHPDSYYLHCECGCSPSSSSRCDMTIVSAGYGLGFVAESQDYKFVRFMANTYDGIHIVSRHVAVYSYKNNSWKELPFPFDRDLDVNSIWPLRPCFSYRTYTLFHNEVATCVNGFCYWRTETDVILSFDLSTDNFSTLPYPDDINYSIDDDEVFLLELDGSLGLVLEECQDIESTILYSFWVYDSSTGWTRKANLDVRLFAEKPLWLGNKNNNSLVLLLQGCDGALLEYNYSTRELRKINHPPDPDLILMISPTNIAENENENENDDDAVDRISHLPDHIIHSILSLLSLKEAASTSVLSTRWSDLWRHTTNIVFHNIDQVMLRYNRKYKKCVNSVVESNKALCIKEFNISFPLNDSTQGTVTKWLEFTFLRGVEVLVLNLVGKRFIPKTLQLKTSIWKSTNLKSLCLKCLEVSGEVIGLFLRNCPLLERLIIKYAFLTSDLEVCGGVLKHLDIQYCRGQNSIKGYAPNLTYLRIDSSPKLIWDYTKSFTASPLTTLEFTLDCLESFLEKGFPQMPTLRKLIVTYHGCGRRHIIRPITSLLRALPYLEEFEIKQQHYTKYNFEEEQKKGAVNNVERFCHCHLRVFKFTWFDVCDRVHKELMSYILDNCDALTKIILHKHASDSPSHVVDWEYVKQLQSKLLSHIQLITS